MELSRARAAAGDANTAERLYRNALEWAVRPRPRRTRESLFITIAGSERRGLGLKAYRIIAPSLPR